MQHTQVVGVGGQRMGKAILGPNLGRQHRPGIDAARPRAEQPSPGPEDRAELALGDGRDLSDPFELILVEPDPDVVRNLGEDAHRMRREEQRLAASRHQQRRVPLLQPSRPSGRLRHQLVDRHANGERQPQSVPGLAPDPLGHVHRRPEEPLGAGQIEEGVTVAARLDDRRVDPKDFMERAGGAGVEPRVGWQQHEIGAKLPRHPHQHAPRYPGGLSLRREGEDGGTVGARRRHRNRPAPERRSHQPLDRGAEGRGIDEQDRLQGSGG